MLLPVFAHGQTINQDGGPSRVVRNAQNLSIGFNGADTIGTDNQIPYTDRFFTATEAYYEQQLGREMPGNRHCHTYISWDIAEQPVGSGDITKEGTRSWFEQWLRNYQGHCDQALITFKYINGVSTGTGFPTVADFETAFTAFLGYTLDGRIPGRSGGHVSLRNPGTFQCLFFCV